MVSTPSVIAKGVCKKFGQFTAVKQLDLSIPSGQIYGFLGPNGCGKSTSIRLLTGLLAPSEGDIQVLGYKVPEQAELLKTQIGYMTQKFSLYDDLSVKENLAFIGRIYGLEPTVLSTRIEQQLTTYELKAIENQRVEGMSGGQKQRLSLAAATIHSPKLLFLDEPTSAVDPENRREFWEQLFDLCDQGTTILISTHYMDEAERCHQLAIMEAGEIRASGEPEQLMQQMEVNVVEILSPNLRSLKAQLLALAEVQSAAQLGVRLRVLITKKVANPIDWLLWKFPELIQAEMEIARPSLEDVFVSVTGEGRA